MKVFRLRAGKYARIYASPENVWQVIILYRRGYRRMENVFGIRFWQKPNLEQWLQDITQ